MLSSKVWNSKNLRVITYSYSTYFSALVLCDLCRPGILFVSGLKFTKQQCVLPSEKNLGVCKWGMKKDGNHKFTEMSKAMISSPDTRLILMMIVSVPPWCSLRPAWIFFLWFLTFLMQTFLRSIPIRSLWYLDYSLSQFGPSIVRAPDASPSYMSTMGFSSRACRHRKTKQLGSGQDMNKRYSWGSQPPQSLPFCELIQRKGPTSTPRPSSGR